MQKRGWLLRYDHRGKYRTGGEPDHAEPGKATNDVCTMPVYRPLIGFDKQEIVDVSEKIDTYETSIQPFEDCCTIFVAKHPVTKPNIDVIRRSEENLNEKIDELMKQAIETVEIIEVK